MDEEDNSSPPDGFICMLEFDRMYSSGLLHLGRYPQEQRFERLRLPVVGFSITWWSLHWVCTYRLWRYLRKRLTGFWTWLGLAAWTTASVFLWYNLPPVHEYFTLEWTLSQKYRPMIYNV